MSASAGKRMRNEYEKDILEYADYFHEDLTFAEKVETFKRAKKYSPDDIISYLTNAENMNAIDDSSSDRDAEFEENSDLGVTDVHLQVFLEFSEDDYYNIPRVPKIGVSIDETLKMLKNHRGFADMFNDCPLEDMQLWTVDSDGNSVRRILHPMHLRNGLRVKMIVAPSTTAPSSPHKIHIDLANSSDSECSESVGKKYESSDYAKSIVRDGGTADAANSGNFASQDNVICLIDCEDSVPDTEITITVYPDEDNKHRAQVSLCPRLMSLKVFKSRCFDALMLNTVEDSEVWYLDQQNKFLSLVDLSDLFEGAEVSLSNFRHFHFVDHKTDLIGKKLETHKYLQDLDDHTANRIQSVFNRYRKVGGDGSCFYRAVNLNLIEQMAKSIADSRKDNDEEREANAKQHFAMYFEKLASSKRLHADEDKRKLEQIHQMLLDEINRKKHDEEKKKPPGNFLRRQILEDPSIDEVLVRSSRCVVAEFLELASSKEEEVARHSSGGENENSASISIAEVIMINFDGLTVEEFIDQVVMRPGRDAEDVIVMFASRAFSARICVWLLDLKADERLLCVAGAEEKFPDDGSIFFGEVHLLLHSGHYDLLYPYEMSSIESGKSQNDIPADDARTPSRVEAINRKLREKWPASSSERKRMDSLSRSVHMLIDNDLSDIDGQMNVVELDAPTDVSENESDNEAHSSITSNTTQQVSKLETAAQVPISEQTAHSSGIPPLRVNRSPPVSEGGHNQTNDALEDLALDMRFQEQVAALIGRFDEEIDVLEEVKDLCMRILKTVPAVICGVDRSIAYGDFLGTLLGPEHPVWQTAAMTVIKESFDEMQSSAVHERLFRQVTTLNKALESALPSA